MTKKLPLLMLDNLHFKEWFSPGPGAHSSSEKEISVNNRKFNPLNNLTTKWHLEQTKIRLFLNQTAPSEHAVWEFCCIPD